MKTREPEDEHCVPWCALTCNTLPLDNSKTYSHPALPYITWGLIWDSKIRREESPRIEIFHWTSIWDIKIKTGRRDPNQKFLQIADKSTFQIQTAKGGFEVGNSASRKRSLILRKG